MVAAHQRSLFAGGEPALAPAPVFERVVLDATSWIDLARSWLLGGDALLDALVGSVAWHQGRRRMYDRTLDDPRLSCWFRDRDALPHPVASTARAALESRYGVRLGAVGLNYYRDGRDSVAFHRDREMRWLDDTVIGVLTLGAARPWQLRPRANRYDHEAPNRGATHDFRPASGDLLVLGGRCQADWEHAVPKVHALTKGRVSVQWRYTSRQGRPQTGGNYRSPRYFNR